MIIRDEIPADIDAIEALTVAAFERTAHTGRTEHLIVDALRRAGQLSVSLVVEGDGGRIVGHVACSPVALSGGETGWYGLGPISVLPERQRQGIGTQLMRRALAALRDAGAAGCVLAGNPKFYNRFGFAPREGLIYPGVPPEYFLALSFDGRWPRGTVRYHEAFEVTARRP